MVNEKASRRAFWSRAVPRGIYQWILNGVISYTYYTCFYSTSLLLIVCFELETIFGDLILSNLACEVILVDPGGVSIQIQFFQLSTVRDNPLIFLCWPYFDLSTEICYFRLQKLCHQLSLSPNIFVTKMSMSPIFRYHMYRHQMFITKSRRIHEKETLFR